MNMAVKRQKIDDMRHAIGLDYKKAISQAWKDIL